MLDLPSTSSVGPEPLRTEPSRSANLVAAGVRGGRERLKTAPSGIAAIQTNHALKNVKGGEMCDAQTVGYPVCRGTLGL